MIVSTLNVEHIVKGVVKALIQRGGKFVIGCSIRSLNAHTVPRIHAAHIISTIATQTIATKLAFHSSKIVQRHATPASNGSITESDNTTKNSTYLSKNFECIHTFAIALICYLKTKLSSPESLSF
jgi:2-polyprenyl-3-methyl-5-hydroxy-6-metoxy-1,4-benzoquinol methylase